MEPKDRQEFAALKNSNLKTARAWALKEAAMALFHYVYERPARKHFRWWHRWAVRSRLAPHRHLLPLRWPEPRALMPLKTRKSHISTVLSNTFAMKSV